MADEGHEERQAIDPVFKQIVEQEFAHYNADCQTEYEVSRLPRTIDAFVTVADEGECQKIRAETPFFYLSKGSQLEFKGRGDRLTQDGYARIRGRMEFLLSEKDVSPTTMTVTIICAGKPHSVFTHARAERQQPFVATAEKGYYKTGEQPPIYLIVINELPIIPKNYPLLIFASSAQRFREVLAQMIFEGERTYIRYAYEVRPQLTKEVLTMAGVTSRLSRKDLKFIADDIGRELVAFMSPKDLLEVINPKDVLEVMDPKDILEVMNPKDILEVMDPKDIVEVMDPEDLLAGMDAEKQRDLLALLSPAARLADMSIEELLKGISPAKQKALLDFLLKTYAAASTDEP